MKVAYKAWQITEAVWILQRRGLVPLCYVLWFKMPQKQHEYWAMRTVSFLPQHVPTLWSFPSLRWLRARSRTCSALLPAGWVVRAMRPQDFHWSAVFFQAALALPTGDSLLLFSRFRHAEKSVQLLRCLCLRFFFYPLNYSWNQMPCLRNKQKPTQFPTDRLWNRISLLAFIADFWSLWVMLCQPYLLYCLKQNQIGAAMRKLLLH